MALILEWIDALKKFEIKANYEYTQYGNFEILITQLKIKVLYKNRRTLINCLLLSLIKC